MRGVQCSKFVFKGWTRGIYSGGERKIDFSRGAVISWGEGVALCFCRHSQKWIELNCGKTGDKEREPLLPPQLGIQQVECEIGGAERTMTRKRLWSVFGFFG